MPRYKFDYTVTATDDGKWLLNWSLAQSDVPPDFIGLVPLYADFDGAVARLGMIRVAGSATVDHLQAKLPKKPRKIAVNWFHEVLEQ